jgi:hypothetical protein
MNTSLSQSKHRAARNPAEVASPARTSAHLLTAPNSSEISNLKSAIAGSRRLARPPAPKARNNSTQGNAVGQTAEQCLSPERAEQNDLQKPQSGFNENSPGLPRVSSLSPFCAATLGYPFSLEIPLAFEPVQRRGGSGVSISLTLQTGEPLMNARSGQKFNLEAFRTLYDLHPLFPD